MLTWLQPGISLAALILLFGAYSMADGILGVWTAIAGRHEHEQWWVLLLGGLVGIGIGTPLVSLGLARHYHHHIPTRLVGVLTIAVSAWTIGASLVLAEPTLASSPATSASGNGQPTGPAGRRR